MGKCKKGKIKRNGKCILNKKLRSLKKKSNNPFKMWGSYVGAVLGVGLLFGIRGICNIIAGVGGCNTFVAFLSAETVYSSGLLSTIFLFGYLIVGFLIGWGIHSLIRRFKK